jgi:hypothetical protein
MNEDEIHVYLKAISEPHLGKIGRKAPEPI